MLCFILFDFSIFSNFLAALFQQRNCLTIFLLIIFSCTSIRCFVSKMLVAIVSILLPGLLKFSRLSLTEVPVHIYGSQITVSVRFTQHCLSSVTPTCLAPASSFFTFLVFGIDARCAGCERRFSLFLLDFSIAMYTPYLPRSTCLRGGGLRPSGFFSCIFFFCFPLFYARSLFVNLFMYAFRFFMLA